MTKHKTSSIKNLGIKALGNLTTAHFNKINDTLFELKVFKENVLLYHTHLEFWEEEDGHLLHDYLDEFIEYLYEGLSHMALSFTSIHNVVVDNMKQSPFSKNSTVIYISTQTATTADKD